jgi:hypothetical protein
MARIIQARDGSDSNGLAGGMPPHPALPETIETPQALLTPIGIEKTDTRKLVQGMMVRTRTANAGEATVPADRETSGA